MLIGFQRILLARTEMPMAGVKSAKAAGAGGGTPPASDQCRAPTRHCHPVVSLVKHDVRGKMVSIFPDHA
jgi:hypothetical protein